MGRTLWMGRAGSGKSRHLLGRVAARIRAGTDDRALLLVPTYGRGEHLKRRLLSLLGDGAGGLLDRTVVTFTSLAERTLGGTAIGSLLPPAARDRLLRRALDEAGGEAFARVARFPGFRARFLSLAKEVKEAALDDAAADAALAALAASLEAPAARRRMDAFARVFAAYTRLLRAENRLDHEDFQARLLRALEGPGPLPRALRDLEWVGVDGFTSFTALQASVLERLAERVPEIEVALPFDPERPPLFRATEEARERFRAPAWTVRTLGPPRRRAAPGSDLDRLEGILFRETPVPFPAEGTPDGSVRLLECADRADEADRIARTAARWVRREGWSPRDVLVIHRSLAAARPLLEEAFARHGVPFRAFASRPLAAEPVARAALDLARLALGDADGATALRALRSAYTAGADLAAGERLAGRAAERGTPATPAEVRELAVAAGLGPVAEHLDRLLAGPPPGASPAAVREALLRAVAVPGRLAAAYAEPGPDGARAAAEAAALAAFARVVADFDPAEGGEGLRRAVDRAAFAPADRRLHAVSAVDAEEARQWEARGVLVGGLAEKEFPRAPREDLLLRDRDRRRAAEAPGGLRFAERLRAREEERFLFYVACTRARERLVLARPAAGESGARLLPSSFLDEVLPLWPAGAAPVAATRPADPAPPEGEAIHAADLLRGALLRVREPAPATPEAEARTAAAGAILDALAARGPGGRSADLALAAAHAADPAARLRPGPSLRRRLRPFRTSASALAAHGQCRFLHFARHVLALREPVRGDEEGLDPRTLGNAAHAALERWFADGARGDVRVLFDAALAAGTRGVRPGLDGRVAALRAREALATFADAEARRAAARPFPGRLAEAAFGSAGGFPPLVLRAGARRIEVRGRIDRIDRDAAGRAVAVDYKVSTRERKYGATEHGEALADGDPQVPLYLLALRDAAGLEPAGVEIADVLTGRITGLRVDDAPPGVAPDPRSVVIPRAGLDGLAAALGARAGAAAAALARGDVTPLPRDPRRCGAGRCAFADLCRFAKAGGGEDAP